MSKGHSRKAAQEIDVKDGTLNISLGMEKRKVTLYINPELVTEFKKLAIDERTTFSYLAERALKAYLRTKLKA